MTKEEEIKQRYVRIAGDLTERTRRLQSFSTARCASTSLTDHKPQAPGSVMRSSGTCERTDSSSARLAPRAAISTAFGLGCSILETSSVKNSELRPSCQPHFRTAWSGCSSSSLTSLLPFTQTVGTASATPVGLFRTDHTLSPGLP